MIGLAFFNIACRPSLGRAGPGFPLNEGVSGFQREQLLENDRKKDFAVEAVHSDTGRLGAIAKGGAAAMGARISDVITVVTE